MELAFDLNDGTLYQDVPPPFQPDVARMSSPNGEIEDRDVSKCVDFEECELLVGGEEQDNLTLRLDFKDAETGAKQYLLVAAEGTGVPVPDTFALRSFGPPSAHDDRTLGPGMRLQLKSVVAEGALAVLIFAGPGKPKTVSYKVPIRCSFDSSCDSGPHFPVCRDPDECATGPATWPTAKTALCSAASTSLSTAADPSLPVSAPGLPLRLRLQHRLLDAGGRPRHRGAPGGVDLVRPCPGR